MLAHRESKWYQQGWLPPLEDKSGPDEPTASSFMPRYMRGMAWKKSRHASGSRTVRYTEIDEPLPRPSAHEFQNVAVVRTIEENPELFHVPCRLRLDRFENLLKRHPNQPLVKSVITGLREGFWPWADTRHDQDYPETWDNSWAPPPSNRERDFINSQRDMEIGKGRFSRTFGPDLLPGMYSTPILAVPKPHSDDLRLVSHQSCGEFSQNSMIDKPKTKGARMDTMQQFLPSLLEYRRNDPNKRLVIWKSDVSEAFRLTPVHPLWQIKQVATSNLPTDAELQAGISTGEVKRNVDWCSTFGSCGSPRIWASVMGLVIWIAIFVKLIIDIFVYVDDTYGWEEEGRILWYVPYSKFLPAKQARLLILWDFLGIPHKEKKQLFGSTLPVIGFEVDPNAMTVTLPADSKADLEKWVQEFIDTPSRRRTLHEFQCLAGWINWSFNMYFLLRPALSNVYKKMSKKFISHASIYINKEIKSDLQWFLDHLRESDGILLLESMDWNPHTESDTTILCDASLGSMGFWIPELQLGFYSPVPGLAPTGTIFFFEALCVASAIRWFCTSHRHNFGDRRARLTVFTDNQNTVDIFNSLSAEPVYNTILKIAVDDIIAVNVDLRVLHIAGKQNVVADAISRCRFNDALAVQPNLTILDFQPPQEALGVAGK